VESLIAYDEPGIRVIVSGWDAEIRIMISDKLAQLKRSRLDGLVAHAVYQISTAKLEGFNNKSRSPSGYRDGDYFFALIRYWDLPVVWLESLNFP